MSTMPSLWSIFRHQTPSRDEERNPHSRSKSEDPIPGRNLIELLQDEDIDWDAISSRAVACPHEIESLRSQLKGQTAIFIAIERRAPPQVIKTILTSLPTAAQEVHRHTGLTPLHFAVALGSDPAAVRYILAAWPAGASHRTSDGSAPLHFVRNAGTARLLIDACPSATEMKNKALYLPIHRVAYAGNSSADTLQLLIDECKKRNVGGTSGINGMRTMHGITPLTAACDVIDKGVEASEFRSAERLSPRAAKKWEKLVVIARATSLDSLRNTGVANKETSVDHSDDDFRILHAVIELGCPTSIVSYALRNNPKQCSELDRWGRSALSIAAARRDTSNGVIDMLLKSPYGCTTNARKLDNNARMPLHLAAECKRGYDSGMKAILNAAPMALEARDRTNLYPFMLAAVGKTSSVDTVYCLLRESPWLIKPTAGRPSTKSRMGKVSAITLMALLLPVAIAVFLHFLFDTMVV